MLKKFLALLVGVSVCLFAWAASTDHLRPDHPDTYVVRKGDTLWDISARFLNKPWLWPEIWRANTQVHNPHLIYPGDVLNLAYLGGNAHLVLHPHTRTTQLESAIAPIPLADLRPFLQDLRVVDGTWLKQQPYVVGLEENRLRGVPGQFIYVRGLNAAPGQRFAIVRLDHAYRTFDDDKSSINEVAHDIDSNVELYPGPWKEFTSDDGHWGWGHPLGFEVRSIGSAEVLRGGDPTTMLLDDSDMEIRKGDRILPLDDTPYDSEYYPHAPRALPRNLRVIAFTDALHAVGPKQVVALSGGSDRGMGNGDTFSVFQPGEQIHDDVASSSLRRSFGDDVQLPDEFVGHVMVFRTFDHVSYALVMDATRPVKLGDRLRLPE